MIGINIVYLNVLYIVAVFIFTFYLLCKYRIRKYIFSAFNIGLFMNFFTIFLVPYAFMEDEAWYLLGITDALSMLPWVEKTMFINIVGFAIHVTFLFLLELKMNINSKLKEKILIYGKYIRIKIVNIVTLITIVSWYILVFRYNGGQLPLFNGNRTFFYSTSISPIYLALLELLLVLSLIYGIRYVSLKNGLKRGILCIVTLLFAANRGPVILGVLLPVSIMYIYNNAIEENIRRRTLYVLYIIPILLVTGLFLQFLRYGGDVSIKNILFEIVYGNTFSDIRDGAFILDGFYNSFNGELLYGKTYLAALLSFIPSSLLDFRMEWSYGRFVTSVLFGMEGHFGLRGGPFLEAFINFGILGVTIVAVITAIISAFLEQFFYATFIKNKCALQGPEIVVLLIINEIQALLIVSSGFYNFYVLCVLSLILWLFSTCGERRYSSD